MRVSPYLSAPPERTARRRRPGALVGGWRQAKVGDRRCSRTGRWQRGAAATASRPVSIAYPADATYSLCRVIPPAIPRERCPRATLRVRLAAAWSVTLGGCHGARIRGSPWLRCWKPNFVEGARILGHKDVRTTMIYTHVLNRGGRGVRSPSDLLGRLPGCSG